MFPMGNGDVMNFGSVSPQGTNSYIPLPLDQVENSLLSPLQNRVSGHMGPQHVPYGPYLAQISSSGPNQVVWCESSLFWWTDGFIGAYMHSNSQLSYFQDRCNALECNLLQVTTERDTIKYVYLFLHFMTDSLAGIFSINLQAQWNHH